MSQMPDDPRVEPATPTQMANSLRKLATGKMAEDYPHTASRMLEAADLLAALDAYRGQGENLIDIATPSQKRDAMEWLKRWQAEGNTFESAHATVLIDWIEGASQDAHSAETGDWRTTISICPACLSPEPEHARRGCDYESDNWSQVEVVLASRESEITPEEAELAQWAVRTCINGYLPHEENQARRVEKNVQPLESVEAKLRRIARGDDADAG